MLLRPRVGAASRAAGAAVAVAGGLPDIEKQGVVMALRSKCLSQGDEVLSSFDSRRRVQVVTHINTHRADRSGVPQSNPKCVRVLPVEANRPEHISSVVEAHHSQSFLNRHGNAELRIEDEQLIAPGGNGDWGAGTR